ncbi:unnamed protein product [Vitrella brassicaformis CCMP3155]|uniref:Nucleotide-diphospho-sugar transferase domain-containing protein n=1 Tax=Vitrella brassicaformis (strain CCMP3155) TaxID=1169540 RepID=A0A0G4FX64_VITBC|nr:unnamed protein product [Vitrella brassicaformis CCMP3155]|eukprot:CEM19427.1 unnamed protein product [Vitrella brassicaformis CCMP3155]
MISALELIEMTTLLLLLVAVEWLVGVVHCLEECPSSVGHDWDKYGEDLYICRSLVFAGHTEQSKVCHIDLLASVLRDLPTAFECPLGIASAFFSLAHILTFQGFVRRPLALIQLGFIYVQKNRGFRESTAFPVQGWDMLLAGRALRERVEVLDAPFTVDVPKTTRLAGENIAILSICGYDAQQPVRMLGSENHAMYAARHGYTLYQLNEPQDTTRSGFWWKVAALRRVMKPDAPHKHTWVLWLDCDAFFMDPHRTIDSIIATYTQRSPPNPTPIATHTTNATNATAVELLIADDTTGLNNGVFAMRVGAWGRAFVEEWWKSYAVFDERHNCSDQASMEYLLLHQRALALSRIGKKGDFTDEWQPWPPQVRIVRQKHLNSFHSATASLVLSREWQEGDFIKHHPGCHYYKKPCQQLYFQAHQYFYTQLVKDSQQPTTPPSLSHQNASTTQQLDSSRTYSEAGSSVPTVVGVASA